MAHLIRGYPKRAIYSVVKSFHPKFKANDRD